VKKLSNCRVLLVDDAKANLDILVEGLKPDHKLSLALNGEKASRRREADQPERIQAAAAIAYGGLLFPPERGEHGLAFELRKRKTVLYRLAGLISSIRLSSSLRTVLTLLLTGRATSEPAGDGARRRSASSLANGSETSQRAKSGFSRITGIRSWISWVSSLAAVVTMAAVPCSSFAFSQSPANPMGCPLRRVM
jgi:hypothetical protein